MLFSSPDTADWIRSSRIKDSLQLLHPRTTASVLSASDPKFSLGGQLFYSDEYIVSDRITADDAVSTLKQTIDSFKALIAEVPPTAAWQLSGRMSAHSHATCEGTSPMGRPSLTGGVRPAGPERIQLDFTIDRVRYRPTLPWRPHETNLRRARALADHRAIVPDPPSTP